MPDFKRCVKRGGKTYCWDFERRKLVEVVVRDVPLTPEIMGIIGDIVASIAGAADDPAPEWGLPGGE
jgi:hypothetical protein